MSSVRNFFNFITKACYGRRSVGGNEPVKIGDTVKADERVFDRFSVIQEEFRAREFEICLEPIGDDGSSNTSERTVAKTMVGDFHQKSGKGATIPMATDSEKAKRMSEGNLCIVEEAPLLKFRIIEENTRRQELKLCSESTNHTKSFQSTETSEYTKAKKKDLKEFVLCAEAGRNVINEFKVCAQPKEKTDNLDVPANLQILEENHVGKKNQLKESKTLKFKLASIR